MFGVETILIGVGAVVMAVLGAMGYGVAQKAKGRSEERREAKEADYERAGEIRDRVERDTDSRLRDFDDAGWRD